MRVHLNKVLLRRGFTENYTRFLIQTIKRFELIYSKKRKVDEYGPPPDAFKYVVEVIRSKREEKRGSPSADRCSDAVKRMAVFTYDGIM